MITVTGILESSAGIHLHRQVVFESLSTPTSHGSGLITTNSTVKVTSDPDTGEFSQDLRAGRYRVTYKTVPRETVFTIEISDELDGTEVSIDELIVTEFDALPGLAPYVVWNGEREGHITFVPIANPEPVSLEEIAFVGGHITTESYSYTVTYVTPDGETSAPDPESISGTGGAKAIRVTLEANPERVTSKRIWRNKTNGGTTLYLLAEVGPSAAYYDDWESHADFAARAEPQTPPILNTTAGVIYSSPGVPSLYFSLDGLRFLADIAGGVNLRPGYRFNLGRTGEQSTGYTYLVSGEYHLLSPGRPDATIWTASYDTPHDVPVFTVAAKLAYSTGSTGQVLTRDANGYAYWAAASGGAQAINGGASSAPSSPPSDQSLPAVWYNNSGFLYTWRTDTHVWTPVVS